MLGDAVLGRSSIPIVHSDVDTIGCGAIINFDEDGRARQPRAIWKRAYVVRAVVDPRQRGAVGQIWDVYSAAVRHVNAEHD